MLLFYVILYHIITYIMLYYVILYLNSITITQQKTLSTTYFDFAYWRAHSHYPDLPFCHASRDVSLSLSKDK